MTSPFENLSGPGKSLKAVDLELRRIEMAMGVDPHPCIMPRWYWR